MAVIVVINKGEGNVKWDWGIKISFRKGSVGVALRGYLYEVSMCRETVCRKDPVP